MIAADPIIYMIRDIALRCTTYMPTRQPMLVADQDLLYHKFVQLVNYIQSNLGYPNADYPKLLGYSKTMDSPEFFLYYLLQ